MKELAVVISEAIALLNAKAAPVKAFSLDLELPDVDGYEASVFIQINRPRNADEVATNLTAVADAPVVEKQVKEKKAAKTKTAFADQPDEIVAALLALFPPKADYTAEEIAEAGALLSSGSHGKSEALADEILQVLKDNGNPRLLNAAAVSIMGQVLEWWDELDDKSAYFAQLKAAKPAERADIVPVIYWKDSTGNAGKLEGKGQLATLTEMVSAAEMSGEEVTQITAKEFAKLEKSQNDVPEFDPKALREEGLALVRKNATSNRDKLEAILREHCAINPDTNKASWTFIKDESLVAAVEALKAL